MASRLVHEVHSLIAFGLPYSHVHAKKDAYSQRKPGLRHRDLRHRRYQAFGKTWDLNDPFREADHLRSRRVLQWKGPRIAEEYMASMAHDLDDRTWDFDGKPRPERAAIRKYWESFCAWLILNQDVLRSWAGVDVVAGRIHRVIDGVDVWEEEPTLVVAYSALQNRVRFLIRCDMALREALVKYGKVDVDALADSNCRNLPSHREHRD